MLAGYKQAAIKTMREVITTQIDDTIFMKVKRKTMQPLDNMKDEESYPKLNIQKQIMVIQSHHSIANKWRT